MSYITLGSRQVTAAPDATGFNTGNYTNAFPIEILGSKVGYFEIYSIVVTDLVGISQVIAYVNNRPRTSAKLFGNSEWDPSQPILMTPADEFYLCWAIPDTGTAPNATVWMRYDPAIQPVRF